MEPRGRAALVTGAGKRVGRAIALELARRGMDLAIHYNSSEGAADEVVEQARQLGVRAAKYRAELTDERAVNALFDEVTAEFPELAVLVNSAAVFFPTPLETLDGATWDSVLDVNLKAYWLCARRAALHMRPLGRGKIVNIGCVSSKRPWAGYLAYSVSKAGVLMLTECLALELAPAIQVNCVAPGTVVFAEQASEARKTQIRAQIPAGREGDPQDIADAVAFFVTGPDYVTGQFLAADGGRGLR